MSQYRSLLALLVAATTVLAGCTSSDPAPAAAPSPSSTVSVGSPSANATDSADVGNIEGLVQDVEYAPIVGANVGLQGTSVVATTDEGGRFAFTDVPVGRYDVLTTKIGFENGAQRIDVRAGETAHVNFTLNPIEVAPEPYTTVQQFDGLMSCGFAFVPVCGITDELNQDYGTPNPTEEHWLFNWAYDHSIVPTAVVFELVWQPSIPGTAEQFNLLGVAGFGESATGPSVLKMVVPGSSFSEIKDDPLTVFSIGVYPDLTPVVAQRFTLYRTDFFFGEPAEDYSILDT